MDAHIKFVGNGQVVTKLSQVKKLVKSWIFDGFSWILSILGRLTVHLCVQIRKINVKFIFALIKLEKSPRINRWVFLSETYFFIGKNTLKIQKTHFAILEHHEWVDIVFLMIIDSKSSYF